MLPTLTCLLALALYILARQRAEIVRLRIELWLSHIPAGSWEGFRQLPSPDAARSAER